MTWEKLRALGDVRVVAAGLLLLQLVWIFAVPPFRGSDEFDHAYRAAAVARGEWAPSPEAATRGTGAWLHVPDDLVEAAYPECASLSYTRPADCVGSPEQDGTTRVASGAGRYHPLYYALVGAAALPFDGTASLYAMRVAGALLAWTFFVLALAATRCWARTRWPYVALTVAMTPVAVYSSVVPAPNGLEMTSALALWSALLGLAVRTERSSDARLLAIGTVSAAVLVTLRSFGPVWCALILFTVLVAVRVGRPRLREIVVTSRGWVAGTLVLLATLGSLGWIRAMGALVVGVDTAGEPISALDRAAVTAQQPLLWLLQSIAAFPLRNENTHAAVYGLFLVLAGTLVVASFRIGYRRGRVALGGAAAMSLLVPAAVTFTTLETYGTAWQGRYTLPYAFGITLLAGVLLERRAPRLRTDLLFAGALCFVVAHVTSPVLVAERERLVSPGIDNGAWILLPTVALGALAVVGALLLWLGAALMHDADLPDTDEEVSHDRPDRPRVVVGADR